MGTNFYIVPKKNPKVYENLNKIQDLYNKKLEEIVEQYKEAVKEELKVLSQDENIKNIEDNDVKAIISSNYAIGVNVFFSLLKKREYKNI